MSSSPPIAQNRPASVMSIPTRVLVRNATSPPSSPKPLSMYWMKAARKRSMTFMSFIACQLSSMGCRGAQGAKPRGRRRPPLPAPVGRSVAGSVGLARPEKSFGRGARFGFGLGSPRPVQPGASIFGGHHRLKLQLLLGAERQELVGRLLRLEAPGRAVTPSGKLGEECGIVADVGDDLRLHRHAVPESLHRAVELGLGAGDPLVGPKHRRSVGEHGFELPVELADLELDAPGLTHELVDLMQ